MSNKFYYSISHTISPCNKVVYVASYRRYDTEYHETLAYGYKNQSFKEQLLNAYVNLHLSEEDWQTAITNHMDKLLED